MQTQWYKIDLYCSKEIRDFLLKLVCGEIEACEAQKIASELYVRSVEDDR